MSVFESIGLAAAQRLERSVGASVALRSYKALLRGDRGVARQAAAGAIRCAIALRDEPELREVCAYWETLKRVDPIPDVAELSVKLCGEGRFDEAAILSAADVGRSATGDALYLHARVLDEGGEDAEPVFRRAAAVGGPAIAAAAGCRVIELMTARGADPHEIGALAQGIDLSRATPAQKLAAARARLGAPSRFSRAAALSLLEELASGPDEHVAGHAIISAAEHADEMGAALSWVEADRVATTLRRWKSVDACDASLARLDARRQIAQGHDVIAEACARDREHSVHLERARATLAGYSIATDEPSSNELATANDALQAIAALKRGSPDEAVEPLTRVRASLAAGTPVPPAAWVAVLLALCAGHAQLRPTATEILPRLIAHARAAPRLGFSAFASAARRAGAPDLALMALRRAAAAAEPDAKEALATELAVRGWRAAERGDREDALSLLREARAFAAEVP